MIVRIATVSVATATALCCLQQPANAGLAVSVTADTSQGIDDLCAQVAITGFVTQTIGHCEPSPIPTEDFETGAGLPDVLYVDVLLRT